MKVKEESEKADLDEGLVHIFSEYEIISPQLKENENIQSINTGTV